MQTELVKVDPSEMEGEVAVVVTAAKALEVVTPEDYERGGEGLKKINAQTKRVKDFFKDPKSKAHQAHQAITAAEKQILEPLTTAKGIINRKLVAWDKAEDEKRREEQRKADEAARLKAEEERIADAEVAEAAGDHEEVDRLIEEPITPPPALLPDDRPKVSGLSRRTTWKYRIIDADQIPREYLTVDDIKIGQIVRAMKGQTKIPGIQTYADQSIASGRG